MFSIPVGLLAMAFAMDSIRFKIRIKGISLVAVPLPSGQFLSAWISGSAPWRIGQQWPVRAPQRATWQSLLVLRTAALTRSRCSQGNPRAWSPTTRRRSTPMLRWPSFANWSPALEQPWSLRSCSAAVVPTPPR
uniref:Uncharacterized protein n=1 Tax=mine drainage metagenome TaxID=410659 RepID=E6QHR1_9ZZZZ